MERLNFLEAERVEGFSFMRAYALEFMRQNDCLSFGVIVEKQGRNISLSRDSLIALIDAYLWVHDAAAEPSQTEARPDILTTGS